MAVQQDYSSYRRHWRAAEDFYQKRSDFFAKNYGLSQCISLEAKLKNLLASLSQSPVSADSLKDEQLIAPFDAAKESSVFVHLAISLNQTDEPKLKDYAQILQDNWKDLTPETKNAIIDACLFSNTTETNDVLTTFLNELDPTNALPLIQRLGLYVPIERRSLWLPEKYDYLAQLQQLSGIDGLSQPAHIQLQEQFKPMLSQHPHGFELSWAGCEQSDAALQNLFDSELLYPEQVYNVCGLWGNVDTLKRVAKGLENPRCNAAAYKNWLYLTAKDLPLIPILQDTEQSDSASDQTFASSQDAQEYLQYRQFERRAARDIQTAQKIRLTNSLLNHVSTLDDCRAAALLTQSQRSGQQPLFSQNWASNRMEPTASIVQLSNSQWWQQSEKAPKETSVKKVKNAN